MIEHTSARAGPAAITPPPSRGASAASWRWSAGRAGLARRARVSGGLILCLVLCACVAGSAEARQAADGGALSQFLLGFWHGLIGPVTLVLEIINRFAPHLLPWPTVRFYEPDGAAVVYDIGFYLGLAGSPALIGARWRRRG